jgi:hypothetical protein
MHSTVYKTAADKCWLVKLFVCVFTAIKLPPVAMIVLIC